MSIEALSQSEPGSIKKVAIYVNGTEHPWEKGRITYKQVVSLAFPESEQHPEVSYTVTYWDGPAVNPEGVLPPGGVVAVKEGMKFRVTDTGQS